MLVLISVLFLSPLASGLFMRPYYGRTPLSALGTRLPEGVKPSSYKLRLTVRPSENRFSGSVHINVTFARPTRVITLHAARLAVLDASGDDVEGLASNESTGTVEVSLREEAQPGEARLLQLDFEGSVRESNLGDWRSPQGGLIRGSYEEPDDRTKRWFVTLTTGLGHARNVFPCFDEPALKASFEISVARPSGMTALSVMPRRATEPADEEGYEWDHFETTPPLSTYSVGLVVSNLTADAPISVPTATGNFTVQVHHRQHPHHPKWQKDISVLSRYLEDLGEYLGVPYPLPKLDIVVLPNFYNRDQSNAMGVLVEGEHVLYALQEHVATDLAQQWFGHLVSPEWWDYINTTDFVAMFLSQAALSNMTARSTIFVSMEKYELLSTARYSPILQQYMGELFLEMLNFSLTQGSVQTGLSNLVTNNLYGTFTENELWSSLTEQAHADQTLAQSLSVGQIAASWLHGNCSTFPILIVTRDYSDNSALLRQHVMSAQPSQNLTYEENDCLWWIPVQYLTSDKLDLASVSPAVWMGEREMNLHSLPDADAFIVVNPTDTAIFPVNYDPHNWQLLAQALVSSEVKLPSLVRRKLLQDALLLAFAGELKYHTALNMTLFLFNETDYSVWAPFVATFARHNDRPYQWTPIEDMLNAYIRCLLVPMVESMSEPDFIDYDYQRQMFWYNTQRILGSAGYQPYINRTHDSLSAVMSTYPVRDDTTGLIIFCPEFMKNETDWSEYMQQLNNYLNNVDYYQRKFWQKSLIKCPGYISLIQRILNATLDNEKPFGFYQWKRVMDLITNSPTIHNVTFNFFVEHFDELKQSYFHIREIWIPLLTAMTSKIRSEEGLNELLTFYEDHKEKLGYSHITVETIIQEVRRAIEWNKEHLDEVEAWLSDNLAGHGCLSNQ
ncbi:aminopeptidase N-like [Periplaneta americana]|uniref:aminopeptidase N-like n=1 Tax=Periplaneta americana TaxID=6978 RepID=UPI0037E87593